MKTLITLLLIASTPVFAKTITCNISTNISGESEVSNFQSTGAGHGEAIQIAKENFSGFITTSRAYLVASITNLETNQTSTFHGLPNNGGVVGGQVIDGDNWIKINCEELK